MGAQWKQKNREATANAKGRMFTKLAKEIMVAARAGADPSMNPRLRMAVDAAKKQSMTKETLERAIKKGAGLLDEVVNYEVVTFEGFAPHQVPVIVECLTENRNRAWVPQLVDLLDDDDDYLVVVGALHLVGRNSVIDLLEQRGYEVVQQ